MSGQINGYSLKEMMGASATATQERKQNIMESNPLANNYGDGPRIEAATSNLTYNPHYNATANANYLNAAALTPGQINGTLSNDVAPEDLEKFVVGTKAPKPSRKYDINLKNLNLGKGGMGSSSMIWYSVGAIALVFIVFYLMSGKSMGSTSSAINDTVRTVKKSIPKFSL